MDSCIDPDQLQRLADDVGDLGFVLDTVDIYLDEMPGRQAMMAAALQEDDWVRVRQIAHQLGSASALVGANEIATRCSILEHRDAAVPLDLTRVEVDFRACCDRADVVLRQWVAVQRSDAQGSKR